MFAWLQKPSALELQDKNFMLLTSFNAIFLDLQCIGNIITNLFLFFHPFSNPIYSNLTKQKMWVMNYYTKQWGARHFAIIVTSQISLTWICTIICFFCLMLNLGALINKSMDRRTHKNNHFLIPDLDGLVPTVKISHMHQSLIS